MPESLEAWHCTNHVAIIVVARAHVMLVSDCQVGVLKKDWRILESF